MTNAQKWLNKNYPVKKRNEITELNIDHNSLGFWQKGEKDLEGSINLKGFTNLKKLSFYYNKELTDLDLSDCNELQKIEGFDCNLTSINFLNTLPNPEKLINLDICGNNIALSDLTCFSKFTNLKKLKIGSITGGSDPSSRERFAKGIYNRFYGSLKPLQNLKELKKLSIANTDIDSGLEYLSESLEFIETRVGFEELEKKDAKVNNLHEILELCEGSIVRWREENPDLVRKAQRGANESSDTDEYDNNETFSEKDGYLDAQKWLEKRYPKEKDKNNCEEIRIGYNEYNGDKGLNIKWKNSLKIEGFKNLKALVFPYSKVNNLYISGCPNLVELNCNYNKLKKLKIINCPKLAKLDFWGCGLTDFDFSTLNPKNLVHLSIGDNNLSPRNVSCLAPFVNLERAKIGTMTSGEASKNDPRNRFCGSLRAFKDMKNLRILNIADTDIDRGIEYLPQSLSQGSFEFHSNNDSFKVSKIKEEKKLQEKDQQIALLQKEQTLFTDQTKEINYLELRVQELANLIKTQKENIVQDFLILFPQQEQELLKVLITTHLEFTKAKKNKLPFANLRSQRDKLRNEIEAKLQANVIEKIEFILDDCEVLVDREIELEFRLNNKNLLIDAHKHSSFFQITDSFEHQIVKEEEKLHHQQIKTSQEVVSINIINNITNNNNRTYNNSKHNEHHQSQFYQEVPPK